MKRALLVVLLLCGCESAKSPRECWERCAPCPAVWRAVDAVMTAGGGHAPILRCECQPCLMRSGMEIHAGNQVKP